MQSPASELMSQHRKQKFLWWMNVLTPRLGILSVYSKLYSVSSIAFGWETLRGSWCLGSEQLWLTITVNCQSSPTCFLVLNSTNISRKQFLHSGLWRTFGCLERKNPSLNVYIKLTALPWAGCITRRIIFKALYNWFEWRVFFLLDWLPNIG